MTTVMDQTMDRNYTPKCRDEKKDKKNSCHQTLSAVTSPWSLHLDCALTAMIHTPGFHR